MFLERLAAPHDVARFTPDERVKLAEELRKEIIRVVSVNGGHLAPPLGVIELTIALHAAFESPRDRIVWDIGHQAYAHKLLTGRAGAFSTLRRKGGLSGYLKRTESEHDAFGASHASTSIAAALGMAKARDLSGGKGHVVAVIGDGAMTGGLAYEALNNAGHLGTKIIIVLNDNSMSISPNVGSMSSYLARLRSAPAFSRLKKDVETVLRAIPVVGGSAVEAAARLKEGVKYALVEGAFFEELGIKYLGPFDGHDTEQLMRIFQRAKRLDGPVLIHTVTQKGRGYEPAEKNPGKWHGASPFDPETGNGTGKSSVKWQDAFGEIVTELAGSDPAVVAITAAMADGTGLVRFAAAHPDRFFDVGIAEAYAVTFAGGLAASGMKPVVAIYSTFLQRAYDQVIHDIALQNLPVVFCMDRAGLVGEDGATAQGVYDIAYLRCVPNMTIAVPRDRENLAWLLEAALRSPGPVALRYPRGSALSLVGGRSRTTAWGQGEVLREGGAATILALGPMVETALQAADILAQRGLGVGVVDARFVKPLDEPLLGKVMKASPRIFTVEEAAVTGGFGDAVLEFAMSHGFAGKVATFGVPDLFIDHGTRLENLEDARLTPTALADAVGESLGRGLSAS